MTAAYEQLRDHDAVHIWRGRAPDTLAPDATDLLSDDEAAMVRRLPEPAAARYAAAHAAVRRVLSGYLGVPPREVVLGRRPCPRCAHPEHGRPRIDWPPTDLDFNLSRSGPHWLLAVVVGHQVGVDLEDDRSLDVEGASRFVMSASELTHILSAPGGPARTHAFFRCWTRKEAVVKAIGVGIVTDLSAVDVQPATDGPVLVAHAEPTGPDTWVVQDLPVTDGVFAALAREAGATGPVVFRHYDQELAEETRTREVLVP
ncbi:MULTISPECIES: 4'-phosphopantetheinyl transferase family protein [Streptomyces]|uniref:4'-phosphopantetheinyl transferase superfamily protein n=1 Tax=Streptomyces doebereineriae TaxID=3075528 RepID=A0ABU2V4N0_9ACTN|nr:4'-phosphopantetheinyl transferase superfamily protein [Streptomyces sp. DSM 41640]MDT0480174.1 4'-phosphopantetheinyl transferase superfamily protein [Streptomyces sp. DSM 41640]